MPSNPGRVFNVITFRKENNDHLLNRLHCKEAHSYDFKSSNECILLYT